MLDITLILNIASNGAHFSVAGLGRYSGWGLAFRVQRLAFSLWMLKCWVGSGVPSVYRGNAAIPL